VEIAREVIVALQKLRCYNGVMNINAIQSLPDEQHHLALESRPRARSLSD